MVGLKLNLLVLHKLEERPLSGYSLCTAIENSTGKRPSYGSIYPLLEKMESEGIVTAKKEGRKRIYTLTAKGRTATNTYKEQHAQLIESMIRHSKMFCEITDSDPEPMMRVLERLKKGEDPLGPVSANAIKFRDTLFRMTQNGRITRHQKEINLILTEAIKRLEKLS